MLGVASILIPLNSHSEVCAGSKALNSFHEIGVYVLSAGGPTRKSGCDHIGADGLHALQRENVGELPPRQEMAKTWGEDVPHSGGNLRSPLL